MRHLNDKWSTRKEKIECRAYRFLGIELFRKAVFKLESIIHKKDDKLNHNYHVKKLGIEGLKDFKKFLYYNGTIHVKNMAMLGIIGITKLIALGGFNWVDIPLGLLFIKDAYCVMLQRYNCIAINQSIRKQEYRNNRILEKQKEKAKEQILKNNLSEELGNKKIIINNAINDLEAKAPIVVNTSSLETLKTFKNYLDSLKNVNDLNKVNNSNETIMKRSR